MSTSITPSELTRPFMDIEVNLPFMKSLENGRPPDRRKGPNPLIDTGKLLLRGPSESTLPALPPLPTSKPAREPQLDAEHQDASSRSRSKSRSKAPALSPEKMLADEWKEVLGEELHARRKLVKAQKALTRSNSDVAMVHMNRERQRSVQQMKADHDERTGSKLLRSLERHVPKASREEMTEFGIVLLTSFARVKLEHGWYKLYRFIDQNGDGRIEYEEVRELLRHDFRVPSTQISDAQLQSIWCTVDEDRSGWWDMREFGRLMRPAEDRIVITKVGGGLKTSVLPPDKAPRSPSSPPHAGAGGAALPSITSGTNARGSPPTKQFKPTPEMIYAREQSMLNTRSMMDQINKHARQMDAEAERIQKGLRQRRKGKQGGIGRSISLPALT